MPKYLVLAVEDEVDPPLRVMGSPAEDLSEAETRREEIFREESYSAVLIVPVESSMTRDEFEEANPEEDEEEAGE
jgi:hypothetical protein